MMIAKTPNCVIRELVRVHAAFKNVGQMHIALHRIMWHGVNAGLGSKEPTPTEDAESVSAI